MFWRQPTFETNFFFAQTPPGVRFIYHGYSKPYSTGLKSARVGVFHNRPNVLRVKLLGSKSVILVVVSVVLVVVFITI